MTLAALIDLGADVNVIQSAIQSMGLLDIRFDVQEVKKSGFRALHLNIEHPPEHAHRHLHHIHEMIDRSDAINNDAKDLAKRIFQEVAVAEAKVHGTTIKKVHFHEVGAVDSIADIVGTAVAMNMLGIEYTIASPIPTGTGSITIAHGKVSVPAPATAEILRGVPIASSDIQAELTTPTGAAIIKATARSFGSLPKMTIDGIGYGAGTMDLEGQANVLRVLIGNVADADSMPAHVESDRVVVLETNVDDSTPEQLSDCAERLLNAGALDVFQSPCTMKKGRAAILLTVICDIAKVGEMESSIFHHTNTIGIRRHETLRHKLPRQTKTLETKFGSVQGKVVTLPDGEYRLKIEDDDARSLATQHATSTNEIRLAAQEAWNQQK